MNILIIGATRGIGLQLLDQALQAGHTVTALVRNPQRLTKQHKRLRVITGDILDPEAVQGAMVGQEAVCLTIGIGVTWKPVTVFSAGTRNVLESMRREGVRRLICVTGIGAGESQGHGGLLYDRLVKPLLLNTIYADKDRQEALIQASEADWTIVRPGFLTNGLLTKKYRVISKLSGVTAGKISRADVADFILEELAANRYLRQSLLLTY
ncbi:MAG: SDR family oxidoreductase [Syntrophobacterales bacterium]|jgi:putative NADH-flavin reductase|nr:SDR family oxidoreductase [Syntrophobacterales bacterium]